MRDLICLYCFRSFSPANILFRCSNEDTTECQPEDDKPLAKYHGKGSYPMPRVFAPVRNSVPSASGLGKTLGRIFSPPPNNNTLITSAHCACGAETRKQVCPHCHNQLPVHFAETESRIIALIGTKSSGKSNYISVLINELNVNIAARFGATFSEVDDQTMTRYDEGFRKFTYVKKEVIRTTLKAITNPDLRIPMVFRLDMEKGNLTGNDIQTTYLVFFDSAGEDLVSGENMERVTKYIAKAAGIIFLIDPLQIPSLQDNLKQHNIPGPGIDTDPRRIIIWAANLIRSEQHMKLNQKIKTPIAFTFSKIDALRPLLDASTPFKNDFEHNGFFDLDDFEQVDRSMRTYLEQWIGPGFNMFPKFHFENYAYFALSALGSAPSSDYKIIRGVAPLRVADPFLWILCQLGLIKGMRRSQAPLRF